MSDERERRDGPGRRTKDRHRKMVKSRTPTIIGLVILSAVTGLCAIAALIFALVTYNENEGNRIHDLRGACQRMSVRNAADVNQNWVYYLSERELAGDRQSARRFQRMVAVLSPGERKFLLALVKSNPSRRILQVRARVDYTAASVKARGVQLSDIRLVHLRTPLGSESVPRQWVRAAHFSCTRAYR